MMKSFFAILMIPLLVLAIDSMNPRALCERFVATPDQKSCQKRIEKMQPDSYLAALCQHQFDDDAFWECLETGNAVALDPKKLDKCFQNEFSDEQRLGCLRSLIGNAAPSAPFQRMPAHQ
jgi:hypothetical protein